jgi:hypothetical protein
MLYFKTLYHSLLHIRFLKHYYIFHVPRGDLQRQVNTTASRNFIYKVICTGGWALELPLYVKLDL